MSCFLLRRMGWFPLRHRQHCVRRGSQLSIVRTNIRSADPIISYKLAVCHRRLSMQLMYWWPLFYVEFASIAYHLVRVKSRQACPRPVGSDKYLAFNLHQLSSHSCAVVTSLLCWANNRRNRECVKLCQPIRGTLWFCQPMRTSLIKCRITSTKRY